MSAKQIRRAAKRKPAGPLLAVDGDSFAHRSYHALPKTIRMAGNKPAGAVLGFANFLLKLYEAEQPRAVVVGWDTLEAPTYRHKAFAAYQSGRQFDRELLAQFPLLREFVAACGFVNARKAGYEADDFLAAAVALAKKRKWPVVVASGDRDTFQLASETSTVLYPVRAGEIARIGPEQVVERYRVLPEQVPDFIALRGDPSDKLPGAKGVGADGAAALLLKYGTLEAMLKAGRFQREAEQLRLFRKIATMDNKAPLPVVKATKPDWVNAAALARKWQLGKLAERLERLADQPSHS
ncbi:5'-3' exonuclease [Rhodoplanes sp. Z2-YC6860]|uniref:5'-3' exonuclease n=1 Tax=Rhodoplanes sp. Z2-YC6860 TaxID=674703 RepID=UPI00078D127F|nr:5'-3' exonuclease [Rhodoplanes sp. Z2-YC6860]AMN44350.1 DNA polymerase I [Rhodoplanes sp. Z2-YC6860]